MCKAMFDFRFKYSNSKLSNIKRGSIKNLQNISYIGIISVRFPGKNKSSMYSNASRLSSLSLSSSFILVKKCDFFLSHEVKERAMGMYSASRYFFTVIGSFTFTSLMSKIRSNPKLKDDNC